MAKPHASFGTSGRFRLDGEDPEDPIAERPVASWVPRQKEYVEGAEQMSEPQVFKYTRPVLDEPKRYLKLCQTDIMKGQVQVVREGGENKLHAHPNRDGFWFVLRGRARFYTEGDRLVADLGENEGILVPRGYKYWFESSGAEMLELLQVASVDMRITETTTWLQADTTQVGVSARGGK
jgi:mannose-6-phosphate isomerase-like protein (cupin superfamily)